MSKANRIRRARRRKPTRQARQKPAMATATNPTQHTYGASSRGEPTGALPDAGTRFTDFLQSEEVRHRTEHVMAEVVEGIQKEARTGDYASLQRQIEEFVNYWKLSAAEAARLVRVGEGAWQSGEWRHGCDAELIFRFHMVRSMVKSFEYEVGYPKTLRWLREPESNPLFDGVVPLQVLTVPDTSQMLAYVMMSDLLHEFTTPKGLDPEQLLAAENERKQQSRSHEWSRHDDAEDPPDGGDTLVRYMLSDLRQSAEADVVASTGMEDSKQKVAEYVRMKRSGIEPPEELLVHVHRVGLYPNFPIGSKEREAMSKQLAVMETTLADPTKDEELHRVIEELEALAEHYQLSDAEAARLLHVEEAAWASGEWTNQFNAEQACRWVAVDGTLQWMGAALGPELAVRWLREADRHPMVGGVVPMEELSQGDLTRLYMYASFVQMVYPLDED